jgi:signal transduction histidine kinase/CheY-like chemotaxis protein
MTGADGGATVLIRALVATEQDVFALGRRARELAAALGLQGQDDIRVATALSEVTRKLLAGLGSATVEVTVGGTGTGSGLALVFRVEAVGVADGRLTDALNATRGLMDFWDLQRVPERTVVVMGRWLPERVRSLGAEALRGIGAQASRATAGTPLEELAEHNRQLLAALAELQAQRDELLRLNAELEETNRGVVALYTELSEELAATNRGVVALYAELDQRTEQARTASEAKTRFLANVSHELRSPVTSIVGLVRLLRDPSSDPLSADQDEQLSLVDASAHSLLGLVNELLDLAKVESGRLEPTVQPTELKPILDTLRGTLRPLVKPDTELVVAEPAGVPVIHTDPILLTQVLRNLLVNAVKFTPSGEVRLSASVAADGWLELVVADTGIGIPDGEQERVFEEFHQVRNQLQSAAKGTGLGLPYARRLVHLLGGTIALRSVLGQGTTVTVRLPLTVPAQGGGGAAGAVLVVDDDPAFRTAAVGALRAAGLRTDSAEDGGAALAAIARSLPALVVLDLRMAGVDGLALLDALASDERWHAIPVVVVSAYPGDVTDRLGIRGVTAVLDKAAVSMEGLVAAVRARLPVAPDGAA